MAPPDVVCDTVTVLPPAVRKLAVSVEPVPVDGELWTKSHVCVEPVPLTVEQ